MERILIILCVAVIFSGCAKLQHLDQLLTLKSVADEQGRMDKFVTDYDGRVEQLFREIKQGNIKKYNKTSILKSFHEAIEEKTLERDGKKVEIWMYRYSVKYFDSPRAEITFDDKGEIIDAVIIDPTVSSGR